MAEDTRWLCPSKQHVLGLVVQENGRGSGVLLFREAVPIDGDITEANKMALVYGELTVSCSCCGQVRNWFPGELELEQLIMKYRTKKNQPEIKRLPSDSISDRITAIK